MNLQHFYSLHFQILECMVRHSPASDYFISQMLYSSIFDEPEKHDDHYAKLIENTSLYLVKKCVRL